MSGMGVDSDSANTRRLWKIAEEDGLSFPAGRALQLSQKPRPCHKMHDG